VGEVKPATPTCHLHGSGGLNWVLFEKSPNIAQTTTALRVAEVAGTLPCFSAGGNVAQDINALLVGRSEQFTCGVLKAVADQHIVCIGFLLKYPFPNFISGKCVTVISREINDGTCGCFTKQIPFKHTAQCD
jgi:hypothetical protein